MISFFKNFNVLSILLFPVVMLLIRLPMLISGYPMLIAELEWMTVAAKMSEGSVLYAEIWHNFEPLSALIYKLIYFVAGQSRITYEIISLALVFFQAVIFGMVINQNNLFRERTFLPAFLYGAFSFLFFDFTLLAPVILGMTFIIFALHLNFQQLRETQREEDMFYSGVLTGVASLFYLPFSVFLLFLILSSLLYSLPSLKKILLMVLGWLFPFFIAMTWFFWNDGLDDFYYNLIRPFFSSFQQGYLETRTLIIVMIIPCIIIIFGIVLILNKSRYVNYQYNAIKIMVLWLLFSFLTLYLTTHLLPVQLFIFVPAISFLAAHYFHLLKSRMIREISFLLFLAIILFINYGVLYKFAFRKNPVSIEGVFVKENGYAEVAGQGRKILVLGDDINYYQGNRLATPYFNQVLSQRHFNNLNDYAVLAAIYENFLNDMPEVIIDQENRIEEIFNRLPLLEERYEKRAGGVYVLRR